MLLPPPLRDLPVLRLGACAAMIVVAAVMAMAGRPTSAQPSEAPPRPGGGLAPGFWDPQRRYERPALPAGTTIRFLTESDYPPFNYLAPGGALTGFNVDLARLLCEELGVPCTIQMRRFDALLDGLAARAGDAVIASVAVTPETRQRADFSEPYYRTPARFVVRRGLNAGLSPEGVPGRRIAVVAGTAHEAFAKLFGDVELVPFPSAKAARLAIQTGSVDALFGDAIQLSVWLNAVESADCCEFRGGPFTESRYFGEGIGIAIRRGENPLRNALNWALAKTWEKGRYAELWLRYFPISPY
jgi:polar amino acid transport system substrate-binding protein